MSYQNTFIMVSEDSPVTAAIVPDPKNHKPTIASIEYDLIKNNPYKFTEEDVQFSTYLCRNKMNSDNLDELRKEFFSKPKACFRASPLVKKYGWGIHYNEEGKIALYSVESEEYKNFIHSSDLKILKGMRSKRI